MLFFSPVNLLDSYEDRFTYSFAFAATASSIVNIVINEDYSAVFGDEFRKAQMETPSYVKGKPSLLYGKPIKMSSISTSL